MQYNLFLENESEHLEFNNFQKYGVHGARNFYVSVKDVDTYVNIYLGVWHLVPDALVNNTIYDDNFNYEEQLATSGYPVLLYFHAGNRGSRIAPLAAYNVLRQFFHIISFDYRSKYTYVYMLEIYVLKMQIYEQSIFSSVHYLNCKKTNDIKKLLISIKN